MKPMAKPALRGVHVSGPYRSLNVGIAKRFPDKNLGKSHQSLTPISDLD